MANLMVAPPRREQRAASNWKQWLRRLAILAGATVVLGNLWIEVRAYRRVHSELEEVPQADIALVLGTAQQLRGGGPNQFFGGRITAAATLYRAGKARHLLLSGNRTGAYDEPTAMREALAARGVPESATTLDYAGFRTLDSCARAKKVFGVSRLTIVTDDFHAARAVLLARHYGIDAQVYCSEGLPLRSSLKTRLREIAARGKALLDLYVLRTEPRVLGPRVALPLGEGGR
jgi:SanA protein